MMKQIHRLRPGPPVVSLGTTASTTQELTWAAPGHIGGSAITGYNVYHRPSDSSVWLLVETAVGLSTTVTGLAMGTPYEFMVCTVNSVGESVPSVVLEATTTTGPTYPTVANSRLWLDDTQGLYTDVDGTVPAGENDSIAAWRAVGGDWGEDLAVQEVSSQRPLLTADGIQCDGIDDWMLMENTIDLGSSDFTMYLVASRPGSGTRIMWTGGTGQPNNCVLNDNTGDFYVLNDLGFFTTADDWGDLKIMRLRLNTGSATMHYTNPEWGEQSGARAPGSMGWNNLFTRNDTTGGVFTGSGARTRALVLVERNLTPGDADDLAIIAKLQELYPTASW